MAVADGVQLIEPAPAAVVTVPDGVPRVMVIVVDDSTIVEPVKLTFAVV